MNYKDIGVGYLTWFWFLVSFLLFNEKKTFPVHFEIKSGIIKNSFVIRLRTLYLSKLEQMHGFGYENENNRLQKVAFHNHDLNYSVKRSQKISGA